MDLEKVVDMRAVQLYFVDHDVNSLLFIPNAKFQALPPEEQFIRHRWLLEGSIDGENWEIICDKREADSNLAHDFLVFEEGKDVRYLKLTSMKCRITTYLPCADSCVWPCERRGTAESHKL